MVSQLPAPPCSCPAPLRASPCAGIFFFLFTPPSSSWTASTGIASLVPALLGCLARLVDRVGWGWRGGLVAGAYVARSGHGKQHHCARALGTCVNARPAGGWSSRTKVGSGASRRNPPRLVTRTKRQSRAHLPPAALVGVCAIQSWLQATQQTMPFT